VSAGSFLFMGNVSGLSETFRCRVYDGATTEDDRERRAFVERLAGPGVIDCPAYDSWVAALQARGWLPERPELEANPEGPGKVGRWLLTPLGREEWGRLSA
jgi:hypothetical protein